jgi:hypothetical protein
LIWGSNNETAASCWLRVQCPALVEQGTSRTGHAKTREAIYKWMEGFLRGMSPQKAASGAAGAVEAMAVYGFRREGDNYARAASLLPLQAALELKLPPWAIDRYSPGALPLPRSAHFDIVALYTLGTKSTVSIDLCRETSLQI